MQFTSPPSREMGSKCLSGSPQAPGTVSEARSLNWRHSPGTQPGPLDACSVVTRTVKHSEADAVTSGAQWGVGACSGAMTPELGPERREGASRVSTAYGGQQVTGVRGWDSETSGKNSFLLADAHPRIPPPWMHH